MFRRKPTDKYNPRYLKDQLEKAQADTAAAEAKGRKFYYVLRNIWGILLGLALIGCVWFQFWLTAGIGSGKLHYEKHELFLNLIAGENFAQIVGLCLIVVNYLFPKNGNSAK